MLIYEDHVMLYDKNTTFNGRVYKNTFQLLESLIIDGTIIRMIIDEKQTLMNAIEKKLVKHF